MLSYINNNLVLINEYQNLYLHEINIDKVIERFRTEEIIKHNGFDYGRFRVFIDSCLLLLNKEKLNDYYKNQIFESDPFAKLDTEGVGRLIKIAVEKGKSARPDIHLGVCGEHGGDPASIEFCESVGLDYVSCSPYRVPIARLAAAQAVVKEHQN